MSGGWGTLDYRPSQNEAFSVYFPAAGVDSRSQQSTLARAADTARHFHHRAKYAPRPSHPGKQHKTPKRASSLTSVVKQCKQKLHSQLKGCGGGVGTNTATLEAGTVNLNFIFVQCIHIVLSPFMPKRFLYYIKAFAGVFNSFL